MATENKNMLTRADIASNFVIANTVLLKNQVAIETDTGKEKIGDGVTAWADLPYRNIKGEQGEKGNTGAKGNQGIQGETGEQGTGLNIIGSLNDESELPVEGSAGDAYLINGNIWVWDGTTYINAGNIQGAKGDKGDKGDAFVYSDFTPTQLSDLEGAKGDKGDKGNQGEKGEQGEQGPKGNTGATGTNGSDGQDGQEGAKGEKGDQGIQGADGNSTGSQTAQETPYDNTISGFDAENIQELGDELAKNKIDESRIIGKCYVNEGASGTIVLDFKKKVSAYLILTDETTLNITPPELEDGETVIKNIRAKGKFSLIINANILEQKGTYDGTNWNQIILEYIKISDTTKLFIDIIN